MSEPKPDHFALIARKWSQFGVPLRPSPDDTAVMQRSIEELPEGARAVILGVTPEIADCRWPSGTALTAVDHSPEQIRNVWSQAQTPARARAIVGDWRDMPFESGTIDFVAGDGSYCTLTFPDGWHAMTSEVARILRPRALFVIRVFQRPDEPETLAAVAADLQAGNIGSVHALKMRLWGVVHGTSGTGTRLADVWEAWKTLPPLPPARQGTAGWSPEEIASLDSYRGLASSYYIATEGEVRSILSERFEAIESVPGTHELGARCPTLVLRRRSTR